MEASTRSRGRERRSRDDPSGETTAAVPIGAREVDALETLRSLAKVLMEPIERERLRPKPNVKALFGYVDRVVPLLAKIALYQDPKLKPVDFDKYTERVKPNLSRLTDDELDSLERIAKKIHGGPEGENATRRPAESTHRKEEIRRFPMPQRPKGKLG
jgi:hypothetical protein